MHRRRTSPLFLSPTAARCPLAAARPLPPAACERLPPSSHACAAHLHLPIPSDSTYTVFASSHFLHEPPLCVQCKDGCDKYYVLKATNSYCNSGSWGDGTENSQGDCKKCPAARYGATAGSTSEATGCPGVCSAVPAAGRYATATGQTSEAKACTGVACDAATIAGRYATATGQTSEAKACTGVACDAATIAGRYATATGQTSEAKACTGVACSRGRYGANTGKTSNDECEGRCSLGRFGNSAGLVANAECLECPNGKFTESEGAVKCKSCAIGLYPNPDASSLTKCVECDAGKHGQGGGAALTEAAGCATCDPGTYQPVTGQATCALCARGKSALGTIAIPALSCDDCVAGKISSVGAGVCDECPSGTYNDATIQYVCKNCAANTYRVAEAGTLAIASTDCVACTAGRTSPEGSQSEDACTVPPCATGTFATTVCAQIAELGPTPTSLVASLQELRSGSLRQRIHTARFVLVVRSREARWQHRRCVV